MRPYTYGHPYFESSDILILSKVEAGQMDIREEQFHLAELVHIPIIALTTYAMSGEEE